MLDLYLTTDAARTHTSKPVASLPTDPDSLIHKAIQIYREESGRDIDLYKTTRIYPQDLTRLRAIVATMIPPNQIRTPTNDLITALDAAISTNQTLIAIGD